MHIIIGVAAGVALLYFWLIGHWFARVLMTIVLAAGLGAIGASVVGSAVQPPADPSAAAVFGVILGIAAAWPLASLPVWYWRRAARRYLEAQAMTVRY